MADLDSYIQREYGDKASLLLSEGIRKIKHSIEYAFSEYSFDDGFKDIKKAKKLGHVDLKPLVELGYEKLRIVNGWEPGIQILERAKKLGAEIDYDGITLWGYGSILNNGAKGLESAEKSLGIKFDPERICETAYRVADKGHGINHRALEALIYAEENGGQIDPSRMPDKDILEDMIKYLFLSKRMEDAIKSLKALKRWGIEIASEESIATLENI